MQVPNNSKRKFWLGFIIPVFTLLYLTVATCNILFYNIIIPGSTGSDQQRVNYLYNTETPADLIIMLGSSRMHGGFYPPFISPKAYNMGIEDCGLNGSLTLLELEYASTRTGPIIFNYDFFPTNNIGPVKAFLPVYDYKPVQEMLGMPLVNKDSPWFKPGISRLFGFYEPYLKEYNTAKNEKNKKVERGFQYLPFEKWDKKNFLESLKMRQEYSKRLNGKSDSISLTQLERFYNLVKSHPKRLFYLVPAPLHKSTFEGVPVNPASIAFQKNINALPHATFLEPDTRQYPDSFFLNTTHVNFHGAKAFSKWLGDTLRKDRAFN